MGPRGHTLLARLYRATTRPPKPNEPIEVKPGLRIPRVAVEWSRAGREQAHAFLMRLPPFADPGGRTVVTLGRGAGDLAIEVARHGAVGVTAIDMASYRMQLAEARLETEALPVRISRFRGELSPPDGEMVDLVLASQCFSGYWAGSDRQLEPLVEKMSRPLRQGGLLAIEFSPPWKAPFGGRTDSRMPWAHLIFPESVIFDEFRRARPESSAHSFADIGIGKVTVAQFRRTMAASGLECLYLRANVGDRRLAGVIRAAASLPPLREYLTQNIYGVWRRR